MTTIETQVQELDMTGALSKAIIKMAHKSALTQSEHTSYVQYCNITGRKFKII